MATGKSKQVKLQGRSRPCQNSMSGNKDVPWLNVSGVWLEELGFKVGGTVNITTCEKLLIIELVEGEAKAEQEYKTASAKAEQALNEVKQTLKKLVR